MATSVKLYYTNSTILGDKWELIPSKLLVVDNLEDYLATKTYKNITDFQYVKNELELSINVDISQEYSQPRSTTNFKYVSIQNYGEQVHYYFVKKATWRSKTCVRFELVMDVLNTFQEGRDFNFKSNTRIVREHKDRFSKRVVDRFIQFSLFTFILTGTLNVDDSIEVQDQNEANVLEGKIDAISLDDDTHVGLVKIKISASETRTDEEIRAALLLLRNTSIRFYKNASNNLVGYFTSLSQVTHTYKYWRNIDVVNEGINPILQNETAVGSKIESAKPILRQNWYLLYRNQNDPDDSLVNPVDCYLIPENTTSVDNGLVTNGRILPSTLNANTYYYAKLPSGVTMSLSNGYTITGGSPRRTGMIITKQSNGLITISIFTESDPIGFTMNYNATYDDISYIAFSAFPITYIASLTPIDAYDWFDIFNHDQEDSSWTDSFAGDYIDGIELLDRTSAKNIKLIKLPYCPYNFSVSGSVLQLTGTDWYYTSIQQDNGDMKVIKLNDLNVSLDNTFDIPTYQPLGKLYYGDITPSLTDDRSVGRESKLFHSDFYQPTYVYDSFTYKVQLEKLNEALYNASNVANLSISFDMTKTINSRFMFTFNNLYFKLATENYAKYMPIARNNEEVLYNVPYINYIRNGFNYDVKSKERSNISNAIGLGLSVASTVASLALPTVPLKVAGVIGSLASMALAIKNTVVTAQQNEDSIRRKLQETANQTASVAGSDDVDLMSIYAENRLKYLVYEPTPLMKSILFDLFFYAGYASGRMGKPSHNTRVNFDYLECEASLENEGSIPDECVQELINCFKTGVCYLHKTTRVSDIWDFEQKYENWEKSVMED